MDLVINEQALLLGGYQTILAVIGIAVLLWLSWRAVSAIIKRRSNKTRMTERELLGYAWPPMAWFAVLMIAAWHSPLCRPTDLASPFPKRH